MHSATPILRITDYEQAKQFYIDGLGFQIDWEWRHEPGFPVFMSVTNGPVTLFLSEHSGDCQPGGAVYLRVSDVDALYRQIVAKGLRTNGEPVTQPWGSREVVAIDPFGNRLTLAMAVEAA